MLNVRDMRMEQAARWLTVMAVVLFVVNGAVLTFAAHAYGWAAVLFAAAAATGVSTGALNRPLHRS